jgi:hypothetical protein
MSSLALPALGQQPAAEKAKEKAPDYYPLKVGSKWHYQVDTGKGQKVLVATQISKIENIDGKDLALLDILVGGNPAGSEHLSSDAQGVYRNRQNGQNVAPPVCLLKYPLKEGAEWKTEIKISGQPGTVAARQGGSEEIQVPAGKFRTVTSSLETIVEGQTISTNYWFAENVGIVKQTVKLPTGTVEMELIKYEAPK